MVPKWLDYVCQIYGAALAAVAIYSLVTFVVDTFPFLTSIDRRRFGLALAYAGVLSMVSLALCALGGCLLCGICLVTNTKAPPRLVPLTVFAVLLAIAVVLLTPAHMS